MTNLTEKLRKGEIYKGTYYCKSKLDGRQCIASFVSNKGLFDCAYNGTLHEGYWEILAEVPSYEQWQDLKSKLQLKETAYDFDTARLEEENTKLKELLKEIRQQITEQVFGSPKLQLFEGTFDNELLAKINQALANNKIKANTIACNKIQENK